jgi:hypothetical protein
MTVLGSNSTTTYVDMTQEVMPWLRFNGIQASEEFALQLIIDAVCAEATRFIGGPIASATFGPATGLGKFDGAAGLNSGYIMLPRIPVVSITSVIEYQGDNPVSLVEVDPSTGNTGGDGYQVNYRTGRLTRVLGGIWNRPFYPGSNNVWVTWQAGYNPIPADIRWATIDWIAHVYRNTQQQSGLRVNAGMSPGDEYEASTVTAGLWAGIPNRIKTVLESYQQVGIR